MDLKDVTILVTGGAGFIGSHLVKELVESGADVTVIDDLSSGLLDNLREVEEKISFHNVTVCDYDAIVPLFEKQKFVFHLAANADVPKSVINPRLDFQANTLGTFNVMSAVKYHEVEQIIFSSSMAVYGDPSVVPIDENSVLHPISPYGASKASGEMICRAFKETYGCGTTVIRISNTFGPGQRKYVMFDLLTKLTNLPTFLEVLGSGEERRDYLYISDTVRALKSLIGRKDTYGQTYNLGSGRSIRIKELVAVLLKAVGKPNLPVSFSGTSWPGDIKQICPAVSSFHNTFDFRPSVDLIAGVEALLKSIRTKSLFDKIV